MVGPLGLALLGGADPGRLLLAWLLHPVERGQGGLPVVCLGLQLLCFRILFVPTLPMLAVLRSHSEVGCVRDLVYLDFVGRGY